MPARPSDRRAAATRSSRPIHVSSGVSTNGMWAASASSSRSPSLAVASTSSARYSNRTPSRSSRRSTIASWSSGPPRPRISAARRTASGQPLVAVAMAPTAFSSSGSSPSISALPMARSCSVNRATSPAARSRAMRSGGGRRDARTRCSCGGRCITSASRKSRSGSVAVDVGVVEDDERVRRRPPRRPRAQTAAASAPLCAWWSAESGARRCGSRSSASADGTSWSTSWRASENGVQPAGGRATSTAGAALASVRSIVVFPQPGAATTSVRRWVSATCTRADDRGSTSRAADIRLAAYAPLDRPSTHETPAMRRFGDDLVAAVRSSVAEPLAGAPPIPSATPLASSSPAVISDRCRADVPCPGRLR